MPHVQPRQYFAATHRAVTNAAARGDAIGWDAPPSLTGALDQASLSQRVRGPAANRSTREVHEAGVFHRFSGGVTGS